MFFKRPSFKYGGEAEGIKQTVRKNFNAGTNPNRTGNAFVRDIFETKAPTRFNVMNEGIGQGLQMKNPSAAMPIADFDDSYLQSVLQPKEKTPSINEGDVELGLGQTKETATKYSEVLIGEKEPPGLLGLKLDSQHNILVALIDRVRSLDNEIIRQDTLIKTILGVPQLIDSKKIAKAKRDDQRKD